MSKQKTAMLIFVLCLGLMGCPSPRKMTNGLYVDRASSAELPAFFKWDMVKETARLKVMSPDAKDVDFEFNFRFSMPDLLIDRVGDKVFYSSGYIQALEVEAVQAMFSLTELEYASINSQGTTFYDKYEISVSLFKDSVMQGTYSGSYLKFKRFEPSVTVSGDPYGEADMPGGRFTPSYRKPVH